MDIVIINKIPLIIEKISVKTFTEPFYRVFYITIDITIEDNYNNLKELSYHRGYSEILYLSSKKGLLRKAEKCYINFEKLNLNKTNVYTIELNYSNWIIACEKDKDFYKHTKKKLIRNRNINYLLCAINKKNQI